MTKKGVRVPEEKYCLVRYTCLTYRSQPKETRDKIDHLCEEVGGYCAKALKEVVTTKKSVARVAIDFYVAERTLYRARQAFYEAW